MHSLRPFTELMNSHGPQFETTALQVTVTGGTGHHNVNQSRLIWIICLVFEYNR